MGNVENNGNSLAARPSKTIWQACDQVGQGSSTLKVKNEMGCTNGWLVIFTAAECWPA
jgi:hypothetical protein